MINTIILTITTLFLSTCILKFNYVKSIFWNLLKKTNYVKKKIQEKVDSAAENIRNDLKKINLQKINKFPEVGISSEEIIKYLEEIKIKEDSKINKSKISGTIYGLESDHSILLSKVFPLYLKTNPLHPDIFPTIRKMESDIVRMGIDLFNGNSKSLGCITSGGTESIMLACLSYRNIGYEKGIKNPNIITFDTVHAAFDKACFYFNIKLIKLKYKYPFYSINLENLKNKIDSNTILIVGSAPSFSHGIMDPIIELGNIAESKNIGFHVDCCLGGFILPFLQNNIVKLSTKGVTSISADTHKYGYCPKGTSLLLYHDRDLMKYQYYIQPDWTGGIYGTSTMMGSRSGNLIALTWATIRFFGKSGYKRRAENIVKVTKFITSKLIEIDDIFIFGRPEICVIGIGSDKLDIFSINSEMSNLGWNLNALQFPSGIHFCVTYIHTQSDIYLKFIEDIKESIKIVKNKNNTSKSGSSIYGTSQSISDRSIIKNVVEKYIEITYE